MEIYFLKYENIFLRNLVNLSSERIIISWAIEGQGGCGHVNERNNDYVINRFKDKGFEYIVEATDFLRTCVAECPCFWFKNTIMVFDKI
jgi:hypothetical protein